MVRIIGQVIPPDHNPETNEVPIPTQLVAGDVFEPAIMKESKNDGGLTDFLARLPSDLLSQFDTAYWEKILTAETKDMQVARCMLTSREGSWNDASFRSQLVRAQWVSLLLHSMKLVPAKAQKQARLDLAQSAAYYFAENGAFDDDAQGRNFLLRRKDLFKTLFGRQAELELPVPDRFENEIVNALRNIEAFELSLYCQSFANHLDRTKTP